MQFISEKEIQQKAKLEESTEPVDNRPLYHRLKEIKDKKQEELDESHKLKNQFRGIDEGEAEFLSMVGKAKEGIEMKRRQEEKELLKETSEASVITAPSTSILMEKPQKKETSNKQASIISKGIRKRCRNSADETLISKKNVKRIEIEGKNELIQNPQKLCQIACVLPGLCAYNDESRFIGMSEQVEQVASHYNAVPNSGIEERATSRIIYLRNFNNWMKSMLISDFLKRLTDEGCPSATVLDLCCGKGGDLQKWKIGKIKEIVMTDVAEVALDHCRNRYQDMLDKVGREKRDTHFHAFSAHFVIADSNRDILREKYPNKDMKFDLVSCQFALHYSFESEETARRLLWNACDALRSGGYFIGTLPDANAIVRFLRKAGDGTFRNDVCRIHYTAGGGVNFSTLQPPLFGAQLNFELDKVVNCPEYLAYFPLIQNILEEFGMKLVYTHSFPDAANHYMGNRDKECRALMNRMKALEAYPPMPNDSLTGGVSEYAHAEEKFRQLNFADRNVKLGTLSKSEWEVASMYSVFAFRKL